ncbi:cysteine hydrolase family protein [Amaricoccus solimangrovi]|uniref:Cysteine hydrolase n=1 Tax=Amaricoccus solimangrovi TaxID=2589815 RepID=A0A501WU15_9RHOB|nr:isochorismatase family cysteine hydrolase [Amaricoccus solimangrovi]TPE51634.1 cysteine hydrolase [Amaricoccus solimangrovi]
MALDENGDPPRGTDWVHLCVDMQRLFWPGTDWGLDWMPRIAPRVAAFCERHPGRAIFTRFIPLRRASDGEGTWQAYYEKWDAMTLDRLAPGMVDLIPELERAAADAEVIDKHVYSPWVETDLDDRLRARGCRTLVVTGGETDMCVLSTVLGAVDRGYRVLLARDGLCSSSDEAHDATLDLFRRRFRLHVEIVALADLDARSEAPVAE